MFKWEFAYNNVKIMFKRLRVFEFNGIKEGISLVTGSKTVIIVKWTIKISILILSWYGVAPHKCKTQKTSQNNHLLVNKNNG